jgi:hypothetical protein
MGIQNTFDLTVMEIFDTKWLGAKLTIHEY